MEQKVPFNRLLQVKIIDLHKGFCRVKIPWNPDLLGDPDRKAVHGGVLASILDVAGGTAAMTELEHKQRLSTLNLRVDYLKPGPPENLICDAFVVHKGNKVCHVSMKLFPEGKEESIALGQAIYSVARPKVNVSE